MGYTEYRRLSCFAPLDLIRPYRVYNSLPKKLGFIFGACADSTDSGNGIF